MGKVHALCSDFLDQEVCLCAAVGRGGEGWFWILLRAAMQCRPKAQKLLQEGQRGYLVKCRRHCTTPGSVEVVLEIADFGSQHRHFYPSWGFKITTFFA